MERTGRGDSAIVRMTDFRPEFPNHIISGIDPEHDTARCGSAREGVQPGRLPSTRNESAAHGS